MANLLNLLWPVLLYIIIGIIISTLVLGGYIAGVINTSRKFYKFKEGIEKDIMNKFK